jgi:4-methyl-5(b-hydroxyethyl)-thiazole monophosphate biosynthesis
MAKKAFLFLADGVEELEAVTPIDYMRRDGIEVVTVSINENKVSTGSHGIPVIADAYIGEFAAGFNPDEWGAALVPGGMPGAKNLAASAEVGAILTAMNAKEKIIAAICAAPVVVLYPLGILEGRFFTCYPGMEKQIPDQMWMAGDTMTDRNITTARGVSSALTWTCEIMRLLS